MNFELSNEQRLLREAARTALSRIDSIAAARAARDGDPLPDLWPTAIDAGWTGLLVGEEHGGAGLDLFDAMLVLEECGRRLNGAGLIGHLAATRVLVRAAAHGDHHAGAVLPALAAGEQRAAIVLARPPDVDGKPWTVDADGGGNHRAGVPVARIDAARGGLRVTGIAGYQLDASGADLLVIPARVNDDDLRPVLVIGPEAPGLRVEPTARGDASRPIARVTLDDVVARPLAAGVDDLVDAWDVAQALLAADALGVSEAMLEMGVAYAKDRYAFGRPIGSYQAVKHQLVEILRHVETTRSLCYYAGYAAEARHEELALASACARFAAERASTYATRTCIAVHGGVGVTWEHDAPLHWRRAQLSRLIAGGVTGAGDRVATQIIKLTRAQGDGASTD
jgi:alkylation response protein AidB-like acyl-CoA dehydrogenase